MAQWFDTFRPQLSVFQETSNLEISAFLPMKHPSNRLKSLLEGSCRTSYTCQMHRQFLSTLASVFSVHRFALKVLPQYLKALFVQIVTAFLILPLG